MTSNAPAYEHWMRGVDKRNFQFYDSVMQRQDAFEKKLSAWDVPYNSQALVTIPAHEAGKQEVPIITQRKWRWLQFRKPLLASVIRAPFIVYEGELGMGKTLAALEHYKLLKQIDPRFILYTNIKITDPKFEHKKLDFQFMLKAGMFGEPFPDERCFFLVDEIQNFNDSRLSLSHINRIFSYFCSQVRKRKSKMIYTGSSAALGDIRLRDLTKYVIKASKREVFDPKRECDDSECMGEHIFRYAVFKPRVDKPSKYIGSIMYNPSETKRTLEQFDSFDVPPPVDTMPQDMVQRILGKMNFGDPRVAFILHFDKQMKEESNEFQDMIYRPFVKIKMASKDVDFEFVSTPTGLIEAVKWRGISEHSSDRKTIEDIVSSFKN